MPKVFIPKLIAEQMKYRLPSENDLDEAQNFLQDLMSPVGEEKKPLNMDKFFTWVIGSKFLKRTYDGEYAPFNKAGLKLYDRERTKGRGYKEVRKQLRDSVLFATMIRCFDQYRQAYWFDADFAKELAETNAVRIPVSILMQAPFRCFYLDVENLELFPFAVGIYGYIGWDEQTHLPNLAVFRVFEPKEEDQQVPIQTGYYSGTDMVKMNLLRIEGEEAYLRFEKQPEDENECAFFFLLQTILYLVSSKPDIVEHRSAKRQAKAVGRASNKNTTEAITVSEIGIRYGKAIRKRRQMEISGHPADAAVSDGAGRQAARKPMASHVRSAHWHHYWTGKGRTTLSVKWIPPTFVSAHGKELPITIHKITD